MSPTAPQSLRWTRQMSARTESGSPRRSRPQPPKQWKTRCLRRLANYFSRSPSQEARTPPPRAGTRRKRGWPATASCVSGDHESLSACPTPQRPDAPVLSREVMGILVLPQLVKSPVRIEIHRSLPSDGWTGSIRSCKQGIAQVENWPIRVNERYGDLSTGTI